MIKEKEERNTIHVVIAEISLGTRTNQSRNDFNRIWKILFTVRLTRHDIAFEHNTEMHNYG